MGKFKILRRKNSSMANVAKVSAFSCTENFYYVNENGRIGKI